MYLFIISKLLGKKQIAQLEFIDYAMGISIGSIAAEMATDVGDTPFYYYLIGMTIFFLFDLSISFLGRKGPFLKRFLKGKPIVIVYEGNIVYKNLKKSKLDINDLLTLSRDKGYFNLTDIAYAIFEPNGKLSILPKANQKPPVLEDLKIKKEQSCLPVYLIADGNISYSGLNEIGKTKDWLFSELGLKNKKELKKILLATYDNKLKKVDAQYKK